MSTTTVTPRSIDDISQQLIDRYPIPLRPGEFALAATTTHPTVATRINRPDRLVHEVLAVVTVWRRPMRFVKLSALAICMQWLQFAELSRPTVGNVQCGLCAQWQERRTAKHLAGLVDF